MNNDNSAASNSLAGRVHDEMLDSFDKELEMEIDDDRLLKFLANGPAHPAQDATERQLYFKELFRLQGELVKLQDWVVHRKLKVVVICEGRDAAGKGGVINRITQRMNPRVCRVAALPAPNERKRTQWYFQRYIANLPAGGRDRPVWPQLVQPCCLARSPIRKSSMRRSPCPHGFTIPTVLAGPCLKKFTYRRSTRFVACGAPAPARGQARC